MGLCLLMALATIACDETLRRLAPGRAESPTPKDILAAEVPPDRLAQLLAQVTPVQGVDRAAAMAVGSLPIARQNAASAPRVWIAARAVSPEYFDTLGIGIVTGRRFVAQDVESTPFVAIVSESYARAAGNRPDLIGSRLVLADDLAPPTVVGVIQDWPLGEGVAEIYVPLAQRILAQRTLARSRAPGDRAAGWRGCLLARVAADREATAARLQGIVGAPFRPLSQWEGVRE
jgi:hypothetical protein